MTGGCKEREALAIHKSLKINECCGNDRYFEEYARFNLDILSEGLARGGVCFSVVDDGVFISGDDAQRRLLFECGILCASHDGGAILKPYANACDIMSAICRISEIFGNRY